MADFFWAYLWPLIIIVAQSVLLMVILLVAIAYVLYADRKIWAAVQIRRGPNVVGPFGMLQSFADLLKFVLKEPVIPAGALTVSRSGSPVARRLTQAIASSSPAQTTSRPAPCHRSG